MADMHEVGMRHEQEVGAGCGDLRVHLIDMLKGGMRHGHLGYSSPAAPISKNGRARDLFGDYSPEDFRH